MFDFFIAELFDTPTHYTPYVDPYEDPYASTYPTTFDPIDEQPSETLSPYTPTPHTDTDGHPMLGEWRLP
jgi:hypothetical protein